MNLHGDTSGSGIIFVGHEFASDDAAYNFYNAYAKDVRFEVRKKGKDKSRRPLHEVICIKYCGNKEGVKWLGDKKKGLPLIVVLIVEFIVLLRYIFDCIHYQT